MEPSDRNIEIADPRTMGDVDELRRKIVILQRRLQAALSAASTGWVEAWHDGNQHMALAPGDSHGSVVRAWMESRTLKVIQKIQQGGYDHD